MEQQKPAPMDRQIRFCPYCFQQQFILSEVVGNKVYCDICGVDVDVKDLVKA